MGDMEARLIVDENACRQARCHTHQAFEFIKLECMGSKEMEIPLSRFSALSMPHRVGLSHDQYIKCDWLKGKYAVKSEADLQTP